MRFAWLQENSTNGEFIKQFGHLGIPQLLYRGKANPQFEHDVLERRLEGMTFEGVVCKGVRKGRHLTMFKIKSKDWIEKLKQFCQGDEKLFASLV